MDAEKLLLLPLNGVGSFLVRESESQPGEHSLSLRDEFELIKVSLPACCLKCTCAVYGVDLYV